MTSDQPADEIILRKSGRCGRVTLNRPKVLNALSLGMVRAMAAALAEWKTDPEVEIVVLDGAGEKGLCAGGDVVALHASRAAGNGLARTFWREEYILNSVIARYPKPFVAIMDGIVMGGGVGLSAHAGYRVVTERSRVAMPETAIGLIPDVGGTWLLSRAPGQLGVFLGLTGTPMNAADAIHAEFADGMIASARLLELNDRLDNAFAGGVETILGSLRAEAGPSELAARQPVIDEACRPASVEAIAAALAAREEAWAKAAAEQIAHRSPTSLKLTLAAIRKARQLRSLEEALNMEYRLTCRLFDEGEFIEGVRAQLVDKDRKPKWSPDRLDLVGDELVTSYQAPLLPGEDLGLEAPRGN